MPLALSALNEIDTKDLRAVAHEAQMVTEQMFEGDLLFVSRAFSWARQCFGGDYPGYQAIDAEYHNLEHTLQGTLCLVRLLRGRHLSGASPRLTGRMFELGLLAILFHDTGYLKRRSDTEGTGAKYTLVHVARSAAFAKEFLSDKGFTSDELRAIQNMIRCTGVNVDLRSLSFASELERTIGLALGTADLLGQMAAPDYVDRLPELYREFEESARYNRGKVPTGLTFQGPEDLMRKTPLFWERYVWPKINQDFEKLYLFLNDPYPDGPNEYLDWIEGNLDRLKQRLDESSQPEEA